MKVMDITQKVAEMMPTLSMRVISSGGMLNRSGVKAQAMFAMSMPHSTMARTCAERVSERYTVREWDKLHRAECQETIVPVNSPLQPKLEGQANYEGDEGEEKQRYRHAGENLGCPVGA